MKKNVLVLNPVKTLSKLVFPMALLLVTSGCSEDMNDLRQYIDTTKQKYEGSVEPLPQFEPYQNYVYGAASRRDPFLNKSEEQAEENTDDGTQPDTKRRKEPLEFFPLDSLKMVGTLEQKGQIWGLIRDPEGTIHRIQPGNHAGQNYGEITRITEESIDLLEIIPDGLGAWVEREISLSVGEE